MSDSWDERRRAQEEGYFDKANKEALARLAQKQAQGQRMSPATGKPMEQLTVMGVVIDRCPETGGIWLDSGELEQIAKNLMAAPTSLVEFLSLLKK